MTNNAQYYISMYMYIRMRAHSYMHFFLLINEKRFSSTIMNEMTPRRNLHFTAFYKEKHTQNNTDPVIDIYAVTSHFDILRDQPF